MSRSTKYPTIAFGRRKRIDIGKFKGKVYVHLHDMQKDKSVTLDKDELGVLFELKNKINKKICKMLKSEKEDSQNNNKKASKKKQKEKDSASSSDEVEQDDSTDSEM